MLRRLTRLACVLAALVCAKSAWAGEQAPVPILTYHRFDPLVARSATIVVTSVFAEQMEWLAAHHVEVAKLHDVADALSGRREPIAGPVVAITADDGFRTVYTEMFPILLRHRFPVTLFINPPSISAGSAYLTWTQISEMVASGLVDVQAHTLTHPNFNDQRLRRTPPDYAAFVDHEIAGSRPLIANRLGLPADLLAWPYGIHDADLEAAAVRAGYVAAFALGSSAAPPGGDAFALPRYQVYNTDRDGRFAAIVAGIPRGAARH